MGGHRARPSVGRSDPLVGVWFPTVVKKVQGCSVGKHSKLKHGRHTRPHPVRRRLIEMVDAHTRENHLLTQDAAAAGRRASHRYLALCGTQIIPAALVEPGTGNCRSCWASTIPAQRARK
jgi:hypothetical protein